MDDIKAENNEPMQTDILDISRCLPKIEYNSETDDTGDKILFLRNGPPVSVSGQFCDNPLSSFTTKLNSNSSLEYNTYQIFTASDRTDEANSLYSVGFLENKTEKERNKKGDKPCSESTRVVNDVDDSFEEELSTTEEDVNSSDIEEMFNAKAKNSKKENDKPLECSSCGKTFKLEHNLQKHSLSHLNDDLKPARLFECETCGKKFTQKHHLQRHYLSHSQEKQFACAHCNKSYVDKYGLRKHLASCHTARDCSDCGKTFKSKLELTKHQIIHKKPQTRSLPVSCHVCQKTFLKEKYLKRHLKVHAKIAPFSCNICSKSFLYPFLLQEHSRSHTGEQPFQCDKCDRKFSTNSNLKRHLSTHSKSKTCRKCCAEFENEEELNLHRKSCRLNYECLKCGCIFERSSNIRRHIKTHTKCSNTDEESSIIDSENIIVRIV